MTEPADPPGPPDGGDVPAGAKPKRRWQAPEMKTGQLFEANSLACFKVSGMSLECDMNPPSKS